MWEGLGYYSRARHLHAAARYFCEHHGGNIPGEWEALEKVKGLGPYTIGAILAFAFHKKVPAVDANVVRVLARYYGIEEDVSESRVRGRIWDIAEGILPEEEPWTVVEGLIELGALVCSTPPRCALCPIKNGCSAHSKGKQLSIPVKRKREKVTHLIRHVAVIHHEGWWLLKRAAPGKLMADLYEFPYFDTEEEIPAHFPFGLQFERQLSEEKHSFTRYRAHLFPVLWKALEKKEVPLHSWVDEKMLRGLAFSSGHRRILEGLDAYFTH
jgi:A/G-specific adenine glycosylase